MAERAFCLDMPCGAGIWLSRLTTPVFPGGRGYSEPCSARSCPSGARVKTLTPSFRHPRDSQTLLFLPDSSERSASTSHRFRATYQCLRLPHVKPASRHFGSRISVLRHFKSHHQICPSDHVMCPKWRCCEVFSEKAHAYVRIVSFTIA